ncbi:mediator of RNA polymerase II transcription subunit 23-like [Diadema antillarum]|uniref:mediator of RNA polymerase II transcription subunit 23-like n=1 Tax=Diadema antillarum TaxID=105358 RepID=UPI003A843362
MAGGITIEQQLQDMLSEVLRTTAIEEAFAGFVVSTNEAERNKILVCYDNFLRFWSNVPAESQEQMLKLYVNNIHTLKSNQRIRLLCDILGTAVDKSHIPAKLVCEALLTAKGLDYQVAYPWAQTFHVVQKVINSADYKGCRDVLRLVLEIVNKIPNSINVSTGKQLEAVTKVVMHIIDRNVCLLPAYFAVTEILKVFPENGPAKHWAIGEELANYIDSFRPVANLVTITGRHFLLPIIGHSNNTSNSWKLDAVTLAFPMKGLLPFDMYAMKPQTGLLRYVLEQPYSRDMVCTLLSLNKVQKTRSLALEEELANLLIVAMERVETQDGSNMPSSWPMAPWQHLSTQLIIFALFQFVSFPSMVQSLHEKLNGRSLTKGRDHLMWVLLQFISGSIKKASLEEFLPVLRLSDLLYPEKKGLKVPDVNHPSCTHVFSMACIWNHLDHKAQKEKTPLQRPPPPAIRTHLEYLQQTFKTQHLPLTDYRIALQFNAYSTAEEVSQRPFQTLVENVYITNSNSTVPLPGPSSCVAVGLTTPIPLTLLDSLTVHAKMSVIHVIVNKIVQWHKHPGTALSPALVETYSRLLVYIEIETLGIKGFTCNVFPKVCEVQAWGILNTLLELLSYRLHHIQPHFRVQLLINLHSLSTLPQTNHNQLFYCIESTALRIITSLGSAEVQPQLSRFLQKPMQLLSQESEELNRALVLTLARAMHVTGSETLSGSWCTEILSTLVRNTPHSWASHTLKCFPSALQQFFQQRNMPTEMRGLKRAVEDEYRRWTMMTSDAERVCHFSTPTTPPYFLCIIWKMLLVKDTERISPTVVQVLERIGPRGLSSHIRTFADYLVCEFSTSAGGSHVNMCVEKLNAMVWKLNILTLDRLVLSLALRSHEGNEAQVGFFIIQLLILKPNEFRTRVSDFIKENSPEHWTQSDWHSKHMAYHRRYPEKFFYEGLCEETGATLQNPPQYLPVYFSNVCLRFLPVFDILIHRFLELPPVTKSLETILEHLGGLFKFHDRPVTYLFNTLHYYEKKLRDRPALKRKLVGVIISAQKGIRPPTWCLTQAYLDFLAKPQDDVSWEPDHDFYINLIKRLVDTLQDKSSFPSFDWRFNEFPNITAHALYCVCVELMALPAYPKMVGNAVLDVVLKNPSELPRENIMMWINAIALVLTSLPESYCEVIQDRIVEIVCSEHLGWSKVVPLTSRTSLTHLFAEFNFASTHPLYTETASAYVIAITHAIWHHSNIGQLTPLPQFLREQVKPHVKTEDQFLFICHIVGPFLQRFYEERTRCLIEIAVELYEMLQSVDRHSQQINHADTICDFFYHMKYMFTGDLVKAEAEKVIKGLKPPLRTKMRFISKGVESLAVSSRPASYSINAL